jgi:hypothetical protein
MSSDPTQFPVALVLPDGERLIEVSRDGHIWDAVTYFPEDREAGFVLLCTGKPRSALRIRTHQANEMRQFRRQKKLPAPYS